MDYIGSKKRLLDWIFTHIQNDLDPEKHIFLDGCAGTGAVTFRAIQANFKRIISNDLMHFPKAFIAGSVQEQTPHLNTILRIANDLKPEKGFFYYNYSKKGNRIYFTEDNAKKIDAMRMFADTLEEDDKNYLLASLLEAMSKVSNTAGTHGAFLKKFKKLALEPIELKPVVLYPHKSTWQCQNKLEHIVGTNKETVLYIDPPYTKRQYTPNYHLYETLVLYDNPEISGKTGLRQDWKTKGKSDFCNANVIATFGKILKGTTAEYVYISYNSDGLLSKKEMIQLIEDCGFLFTLKKMKFRRYKADNNREYRNDTLYEYLFCCKKCVAYGI